MLLRQAIRALLNAALVGLTSWALACEPPSEKSLQMLDDTGARSPLPSSFHTTPSLDASFAKRLRLIGAHVPNRAAAGAVLPITLMFLVERTGTTTTPMVFVHGSAPGAELVQARADHPLLRGRVPPSSWRIGDVLFDRFELVVPLGVSLDTWVVWVGLVDAENAAQPRWAVEPKSAHDGKHRVEVGRIRVIGGAPVQTAADARRARAPLTIDGVLDESDWTSASRLGPFQPYDGKSKITRRTWARVLWDEAHLYVAFEAEDPDIFTPYTRNDDPLYESEAVEVFIDADGDRDVYVELQAAPANDLHFDAAFAGGRRKGMERAWDAPYVTHTTRTSTGFVSEWQIPVRALRDVPAGEPRVGASWQVNFFRLERLRTDARVAATEASAWSSPLSGDFHNLERFATLRFVE